MSYKINTFITSDTSIQNGDKKLSICLSTNGFSFSVTSNNQLLALGDVACDITKSLGTDMGTIRSALTELKITPVSFGEVEIIEPVQKFTLIPEHLYKKGEEKTLLQTVCEIENAKNICVDYSEKMQLYALFVSENPLNQPFKFVAAKYKLRCQHEILAESYLREKSKNKSIIALNVRENYFDVCLFCDQNFKMSNTLKLDTKADVAYNLLNISQQMMLKPENTELYISGNVDKEWYDYLCKYFVKVNLNNGRKLKFENEEFYHLHAYKYALILN